MSESPLYEPVHTQHPVRTGVLFVVVSIFVVAIVIAFWWWQSYGFTFSRATDLRQDILLQEEDDTFARLLDGKSVESPQIQDVLEGIPDISDMQYVLTPNSGWETYFPSNAPTLLLGKTRSEVRQTLGEPPVLLRQHTNESIEEDWVYFPYLNDHTGLYIDFSSGIVISSKLDEYSGLSSLGVVDTSEVAADYPSSFDAVLDFGAERTVSSTFFSLSPSSITDVKKFVGDGTRIHEFTVIQTREVDLNRSVGGSIERLYVSVSFYEVEGDVVYETVLFDPQIAALQIENVSVNNGKMVVSVSDYEDYDDVSNSTVFRYTYVLSFLEQEVLFIEKKG